MSCLFNSFSALTGERPQAIRERICDWLATDPAILDDLSASTVVQIESGHPLDRYVTNMRSVNTWGGAIEIRAFVQLWKRPVRVFVKRGRPQRWIEFPLSDASGSTVDECKLSWTGAHYEPIR
jgi:hypothetical protein